MLSAIKKINSNGFLFALLLIGSVVAIGASFWKYYYTKDYDFIVEASCEPQIEYCFFRDCEANPDSCPPNGLSNYKVFNIKAYDFDKCADNSCKVECESNKIACTQVECDSSNEDVCSSPEGTLK
jgi:hypothetical protein